MVWNPQNKEYSELFDFCKNHSWNLNGMFKIVFHIMFAVEIQIVSLSDIQFCYF